MNRGLTVLIALLCVSLTSAAQIALKVGVSSPALRAVMASDGTVAFIVRALISAPVLGGLVLYAASTLLWLTVLAKADVSFAYPFVSLGFVIIAVYGHFVLHEPLSVVKAAGIALITVGVICIARS
ncbi:MAG TPA: EamA family transporter [Steroidobacteraceae bacterium]|nr:EamA family transporter [Steroidobacteraceae bacterium]